MVPPWYAFAMTAVLLAPLAVLREGAPKEPIPLLLSLGSTVGALAGMVQFLCLIRWPFPLPYLARTAGEPDAPDVRKEAADVGLTWSNRYLRVALGEHLGHLLTGLWSALVGAAIMQSDARPAWPGLVGIVAGAGLSFCSLEFVGPLERGGRKVAAEMTPATYIVRSLRLVATGLAMVP